MSELCMHSASSRTLTMGKKEALNLVGKCTALQCVQMTQILLWWRFQEADKPLAHNMIPSHNLHMLKAKLASLLLFSLASVWKFKHSIPYPIRAAVGLLFHATMFNWQMKSPHSYAPNSIWNLRLCQHSVQRIVSNEFPWHYEAGTTTINRKSTPHVIASTSRWQLFAWNTRMEHKTKV